MLTGGRELLCAAPETENDCWFMINHAANTRTDSEQLMGVGERVTFTDTCSHIRPWNSPITAFHPALFHIAISLSLQHKSHSRHVMPLEAGSSAVTLAPSVTSKIIILPSDRQAASMGTRTGFHIRSWTKVPGGTGGIRDVKGSFCGFPWESIIKRVWILVQQLIFYTCIWNSLIEAVTVFMKVRTS